MCVPSSETKLIWSQVVSKLNYSISLVRKSFRSNKMCKSHLCRRCLWIITEIGCSYETTPQLKARNNSNPFTSCALRAGAKILFIIMSRPWRRFPFEQSIDMKLTSLATFSAVICRLAFGRRNIRQRPIRGCNRSNRTRSTYLKHRWKVTTAWLKLQLSNIPKTFK